MHNQPYVGRIADCTRKKTAKNGEIRHFYGTRLQILVGKQSPSPYDKQLGSIIKSSHEGMPPGRP